MVEMVEMVETYLQNRYTKTPINLSKTKKMLLFWFLEFTFIVFYMSGITHFCGNFRPSRFVAAEAFYLFSCLAKTLTYHFFNDYGKKRVEEEKFSHYNLSIIQVIMLTGLFIFSLIGNSLALYTLMLGKSSLGKKRSKTIFLHITLADVLVTLFPMAGTLPGKVLFLSASL